MIFSIFQYRFQNLLLNVVLFLHVGFSANSPNQQVILKQIHQFHNLLSNSKRYTNVSSYISGYLQDDLYIQRWLQAGNVDVAVAHNKFLDHLKWRRLEKIDTIHLEDWSQFQEDYPQFLGSTDKFGRPVAEYWLSDWDFRRAYITGQAAQLKRWMAYLMEMGQRKLYEIRRGGQGLKNVTGVVELVDLEGFNSFKHACPRCVAMQITTQLLAKDQYPNIWHANYMVNVGQMYRSLLAMSKKGFKYGSDADDPMKIYSEKAEWLPVIEREISSDQRSTRFGGTLNK